MANSTLSAERLHGIGYSELRHLSSWFMGLGVALIVLGLIAMALAVTTTVTSLIIFGWLLVVGGVLEVINGVRSHTWSTFFIDLVIGVLYGVAGFLIVTNPAATAVGLTLLIAMLLIVGGIFRITAALAIRYPNWGWLALHGGLSLVLGILIWQGLPGTGLWVIGLYIGIELLMNGVALTMLGSAAKRLNVEA